MVKPDLPRYSARSHDLGRFRDDPADRVIEAFVKQADGAVVAELDEEAFYTLLHFARRAAVRALRVPDLATARTGVKALTLVDRDRIDYRDLSVDFPLLAVKELGGDVQAEIDHSVRNSPAATAESFEAARARAVNLSLRDCALVRVESRYGVGFIEDWTGARTPPVDLAQAVVGLLDLVDDEGTYRIEALHVSDLPGVWFGERDDIPGAGCVSFSADHVHNSQPYSHTLLVFVADLAKPRHARRLAEAARRATTVTRPRLGVVIRDRLAVFIGGSVTQGEEALEDDQSLQRFAQLAVTVL